MDIPFFLWSEALWGLNKVSALGLWNFPDSHFKLTYLLYINKTKFKSDARSYVSLLHGHMTTWYFSCCWFISLVDSCLFGTKQSINICQCFSHPLSYRRINLRGPVLPRTRGGNSGVGSWPMSNQLVPLGRSQVQPIYISVYIRLLSRSWVPLRDQPWIYVLAFQNVYDSDTKMTFTSCVLKYHFKEIYLWKPPLKPYFGLFNMEVSSNLDIFPHPTIYHLLACPGSRILSFKAIEFWWCELYLPPG